MKKLINNILYKLCYFVLKLIDKSDKVKHCLAKITVHARPKEVIRATELLNQLYPNKAVVKNFELIRETYKNIIQHTCDTILKRNNAHLENFDLVRESLKNNSVLIFAGHFVNFESVLQSIKNYTSPDLIRVFYKKQDLFNDQTLDIRGVRHYEVGNMGMRDLNNDVSESNKLFFCLFDQYHPQGETFSILNRETRLSTALSKFAIKKSISIFYADFYYDSKGKNVNTRFIPIHDSKKNKLTPYELTNNLAQCLGDTIKRNPTKWMCLIYSFWKKDREIE